MELGAYDFMIKSMDLEGIDVVIALVLDDLRTCRRLESELGRHDSQYHMKRLETHRPSYEAATQTSSEVIESPRSSVTLLGETGTGKEFMAHGIHHNGLLTGGRSTATAIPKDAGCQADCSHSFLA